MTNRKKRAGSIKKELIKKSREAALAAVQVFNNPNISFKSEIYVVLMIISWTYLLHAYYRGQKIEYCYYQQNGKRKKYDTTKHGARKYWELERCLNEKKSPIDSETANNLRFLIGLRHEIEHQMTTGIDDILSTRFQACCLNYNIYIKKLFGEKEGIEKHLSFSLQFSTISKEQKELLEEFEDLPSNIYGFIMDFDQSLSKDELNSQHFSYRVLFVPKLANSIGQADTVIEFVKSDSPLAKDLNKKYAFIKETERKKYSPTQVVNIMKEEGNSNFSMYNHTQIWKTLDAKNPGKGFGVLVAEKNWLWYERWVDEVRKQCKKYPDKYR